LHSLKQNSSLAHPDSYREVRAKRGNTFFMKHCVYIIFSKSLDKFYVGETSDLTKRLEEHKAGFYVNSFTSKTNDWILFFKIDCQNISQAFKIERHIKDMKSTKYIHNLREYPEIVIKLKNKYN
jgi:putative endonuclease